MKDANNVLVKTGANTQAGRQIRFTDAREIIKLKPVLKAYVQEAIAVEKSGLKVDFKKTEDFPVPPEFQKKLNELPSLKKAFEALTPGRQRGYLLYFSNAKQARTREARVAKYIQKILGGEGLND